MILEHGAGACGPHGAVVGGPVDLLLLAFGLDSWMGY